MNEVDKTYVFFRKRFLFVPLKGKIPKTYVEEFPPTEMGMHTVEQVLVRTIFHEGMHLAAIIALRKFL